MLLIRDILLHHAANAAIGIEVLADGALLVERSTDLLSCTTDCSLGCSNRHQSCNTVSGIGARTGELLPNGAGLVKQALPSSLCLFASCRLQRR